MSFLTNVPTYIAELESEIDQLGYERMNINWGHDCDCEYCDRKGEDGADDAEEQSSRIDQEIYERRRMIKRLQRYAKLFNHRT